MKVKSLEWDLEYTPHEVAPTWGFLMEFDMIKRLTITLVLSTADDGKTYNLDGSILWREMGKVNNVPFSVLGGYKSIPRVWMAMCGRVNTAFKKYLAWTLKSGRTEGR